MKRRVYFFAPLLFVMLMLGVPTAISQGSKTQQIFGISVGNTSEDMGLFNSVQSMTGRTVAATFVEPTNLHLTSSFSQLSQTSKGTRSVALTANTLMDVTPHIAAWPNPISSRLDFEHQSLLFQPGPEVVTVNTTSTNVDGDTRDITALEADPGVDKQLSFPEALIAVNNSTPGKDKLLRFALPHGSTIALPQDQHWLLTQSYTTIDGDTDLDGKPDIVIDGLEGRCALAIQSDHNVIRNLVIQGLCFLTPEAHDNLVAHSYLGTDVSGQIANGKTNNGVEIREGAHHNTIENNVIAGNAGSAAGLVSVGVMIWAGAHENIVRGNQIGVNAKGAPLANGYGVVIGNASWTSGDASKWGDIWGNIIGGARSDASCTGACNLIWRQQHIWCSALWAAGH